MALSTMMPQRIQRSPHRYQEVVDGVPKIVDNGKLLPSLAIITRIIR
ncbi:MAG: hypothetical protein ACYTXF_33260 [Nostoc sp.]